MIRFLTVLLIAALSVAGSAMTSCGGSDEAPEPAPDAAEPQDVTPPVEPEATDLPGTASDGEADPELEAAILEASPDYNRESVEIMGNPARYVYERIDLDDDGREEVLTYLMGPFFCGSGGCPLMVFTERDGGYAMVQDFPITQTPVIVAAEASQGWKNLVRMEAGGGAPVTWVTHTFNGTKYVERGRAPGDPEPEGTKLFDDGVTYADGIPLEPTS